MWLARAGQVALPAHSPRRRCVRRAYARSPNSQQEKMTAKQGRAERLGKRQLEQSVSWTSSERLRCLWHQFRLTVQEINYASRRMVELQMRLP